MLMNVRNLFLSLTALASSASFADIYRLDLTRFGSTQTPAACQEAILAVAQQFYADAHVEGVSATCELDPNSNDTNGVVGYIAPAPAAIWTTEDRHSSLNEAVFDTLASCETSLTQEVAVMRRRTGLRPFAAYCFQTSTFGRPYFRTYIAAAGSSNVVKTETSAYLPFALENPEQVVGQLAAQVANQSVDFVQWTLDNKSLHWSLSLAMYEQAENRHEHRLRVLDSWFYKSVAECQQAGQNLLSRWDHNIHPVVPACTKLSQNRSKLVLLWWSQNIVDEEIVKGTVIPASFTSMDQCAAKAVEVEAALRRSGTTLYGSLCGNPFNSNTDIELEVFTKK